MGNIGVSHCQEYVSVHFEAQNGNLATIESFIAQFFTVAVHTVVPYELSLIILVSIRLVALHHTCWTFQCFTTLGEWYALSLVVGHLPVSYYPHSVDVLDKHCSRNGYNCE